MPHGVRPLPGGRDTGPPITRIHDVRSVEGCLGNRRRPGDHRRQRLVPHLEAVRQNTLSQGLRIYYGKSMTHRNARSIPSRNDQGQGDDARGTTPDHSSLRSQLYPCTVELSHDAGRRWTYTAAGRADEGASRCQAHEARMLVSVTCCTNDRRSS